MARRFKHIEEPEILPSLDPKMGIELLNRQKAKLEQLIAKQPIDKAAQKAWENTTKDYLTKIFGSKSENIDAVIDASSDFPLYMGMSDYELEEYKLSKMKNQAKMIDSCIEQLETNIELSFDRAEYFTKNEQKEKSNKVFIVHGHNHGIKESLARLITKLGLEPIILHEQPNGGRTLIEKFTDFSDVHFAIVILSADDLGAPKEHRESFKERARQNVIFELGFFIGKLGRKNVCPILESDVEKPSDYDGVVYITLDKEDKWKIDIIRELKAVGFNVDANKMFEN